MNRKFREGHIYRIVAHDHNSGAPETTITFAGAYVGRSVRNGRRFVVLCSVYHQDDHDPSYIITLAGSYKHIIEREIVSVKDLGRAA